MKRRVKTSLYLLLFALCLPSLFFVRKAYMLSYPVLGTDGLKDVRLIEDHRDAMAMWLQKGVRNAVLVNIDAHDDLKRVPPDEIEKMRQGCLREPLELSGSNDGCAPPGNNNFIYIAAKLGIVKKVIWVIPSSYDLFSDSGTRLGALLKMYGFTDQDILTFTPKGRSFTGTVDGVPVTICDIASLPKIRDPVLLTLDVDYFPAMVNDASFVITKSVTDTFKALFAKGYEIKDATVAYSVNGSFLSTCYRWVGDLSVDILRDPALLSQNELPVRYLFLQRADMLLVMKRYQELLQHTSIYLENQGTDPSVYIYAAQAQQGLGNTSESFRLAEKACMAEKDYCYGLPELGGILLQQYDLNMAEKFFARGYALCPDMDHGQFPLAMALRKSGRHDDAIRYFQAFRNCYGSFPVDFYIAETYLMKGDEKSALAYYDSGRRALAKNAALLSGFGDFKTLEKAAEFYERKGHVMQAAELRKIAATATN